MSRTVITLKFKSRWFPEEAGYSAEKGYTDINLPPLMSNEDKNISGSLILDLRKWRHVQAQKLGLNLRFAELSRSILTLLVFRWGYVNTEKCSIA